MATIQASIACNSDTLCKYQIYEERDSSKILKQRGIGMPSRIFHEILSVFLAAFFLVFLPKLLPEVVLGNPTGVFPANFPGIPPWKLSRIPEFQPISPGVFHRIYFQDFFQWYYCQSSSRNFSQSSLCVFSNIFFVIFLFLFQDFYKYFSDEVARFLQDSSRIFRNFLRRFPDISPRDFRETSSGEF